MAVADGDDPHRGEGHGPGAQRLRRSHPRRRCPGDLAIGHTRYSTTGSIDVAQRPARVPGRRLARSSPSATTATSPTPRRWPTRPGCCPARSRATATSSPSCWPATWPAKGGDLADALAAVLPRARRRLLPGAARRRPHLSASATRTASGRCASDASTAAGCWPARRPRSTSSAPTSSASSSPARWWSSTRNGPRSLHPFAARAHRPQAVPVRVRVLRPPRRPAVRPQRGRRPRAHGGAAGRAGAAAARPRISRSGRPW